MKKLYICDSQRKIKDGKCNGVGCTAFNDCFLTKDKEYAKEYVSLEEVVRYFEEMIEVYRYEHDDEKAEQYLNALKGVKEALRLRQQQ